MYITCIYIYLYHYHLSPYFLKGIQFSKVIYGIHYHTLVPKESISSYTKPRIYFACIEGQRANACRGQNLFEIWPNRNVPGRVQLASGLYFGSVVCYCVWNFSSSPHNIRHWIHHIYTFENLLEQMGTFIRILTRNDHMVYRTSQLRLKMCILYSILKLENTTLIHECVLFIVPLNNNNNNKINPFSTGIRYTLWLIECYHNHAHEFYFICKSTFIFSNILLLHFHNMIGVGCTCTLTKISYMLA